MADFSDRYPLNVPGKYYVDANCTDCDLCRETTGGMIRRDEVHGYSYVARQPSAAEEMVLFEESVTGCPTSAVGSDGDSHDWSAEPIYDWALYSPQLKLHLQSLPIKESAEKVAYMSLYLRYLFRREQRTGPFDHLPLDYEEKKDGSPKPKFWP